MRNNHSRDHHGVILALVVALGFAVGALAYPHLPKGSAEAGESGGYTWYVRDNGTATVYELESRPKWRDGTIRLQHKGNEIWINGNWSAYKLQNK